MRERFEGEEGKRRLVEAFADQELVQHDRALAQKLADIAGVEDCEKARELYIQDETPKNVIYFILSGAFDLIANGKYIRTAIAKQAVGEYPLIDPSLRYTVTTRAREKSVVAKVSEDQFLRLGEEHPVLWKNLASVLVARLRETTNILASAKGFRVFIGHGHASLGRELKDFIQDRLHLAWDEFNREPIAGVTNIDRLLEMLNSAAFAFVVLTAEDEQADGQVRARMNVIHEAGLFHGRLGFTKAIVLLEEGCEEFSNIYGLGQIRFPRGNIQAIFEKVRRVLEREGLLKE